MANKNEHTYIMIRHNGVQRGLVGEIIKRFEQKGYRLTAMKMQNSTKEKAEEHYKDLKAQPFFAGLIQAMQSGPVVCLVFTGENAVAAGRALIGETDPLKSAAGTIRGDFAIQIARNLIHGSDSVANAQRDIALWFKPEDLLEWTPCGNAWLYE